MVPRRRPRPEGEPGRRFFRIRSTYWWLASSECEARAVAESQDLRFGLRWGFAWGRKSSLATPRSSRRENVKNAELLACSESARARPACNGAADRVAETKSAAGAPDERANGYDPLQLRDAEGSR